MRPDDAYALVFTWAQHINSKTLSLGNGGGLTCLCFPYIGVSSTVFKICANFGLIFSSLNDNPKNLELLRIRSSSSQQDHQVGSIVFLVMTQECSNVRI